MKSLQIKSYEQDINAPNIAQMAGLNNRARKMHQQIIVILIIHSCKLPKWLLRAWILLKRIYKKRKIALIQQPQCQLNTWKHNLLWLGYHNCDEKNHNCQFYILEYVSFSARIPHITPSKKMIWLCLDCTTQVNREALAQFNTSP